MSLRIQECNGLIFYQNPKPSLDCLLVALRPYDLLEAVCECSMFKCARGEIFVLHYVVFPRPSGFALWNSAVQEDGEGRLSKPSVAPRNSRQGRNLYIYT